MQGVGSKTGSSGVTASGSTGNSLILNPTMSGSYYLVYKNTGQYLNVSNITLSPTKSTPVYWDSSTNKLYTDSTMSTQLTLEGAPALAVPTAGGLVLQQQGYNTFFPVSAGGSRLAQSQSYNGQSQLFTGPQDPTLTGNYTYIFGFVSA
jgi:WD40 repeat protein